MTVDSAFMVEAHTGVCAANDHYRSAMVFVGGELVGAVQFAMPGDPGYVVCLKYEDGEPIPLEIITGHVQVFFRPAQYAGPFDIDGLLTKESSSTTKMVVPFLPSKTAKESADMYQAVGCYVGITQQDT